MSSLLRERIAEAMRRHPGLSQADVARACGVKTPSVTDWLNGKTKSLKPEPARRGAVLFGCDQNWLATGTGTPNWGGALSAQATATARATADLSVGKPPDLDQALRVVLARLPGLDRYTAAKVQGAIEAALQPVAPLDRIERDLLQWLSEAAAREPSTAHLVETSSFAGPAPPSSSDDAHSHRPSRPRDREPSR